MTVNELIEKFNTDHDSGFRVIEKYIAQRPKSEPIQTARSLIYFLLLKLYEKS